MFEPTGNPDGRCGGTTQVPCAVPTIMTPVEAVEKLISPVPVKRMRVSRLRKPLRGKHREVPHPPKQTFSWYHANWGAKQ
jgi:hypothetical protein